MNIEHAAIGSRTFAGSISADFVLYNAVFRTYLATH